MFFWRLEKKENKVFWKVFFQLIRKDLVIFRKEYFGKIVDMLISFCGWVVVFGYFVPSMGMESSYGLFITVGAIASFGIFDIIGQSSVLISDIQGDRTISYLLLLPISPSAIFCSIAISWSLQSLMLAIPLYFVGKLLFWQQFGLNEITWHQLFLMMLTVNVFFGFFALWIASVLHKVRDISRIYFRFLNPLFVFGCYFYTWQVAFDLSPVIGYLFLMDPFSYVMEISRTAILGQEGYLPFWLSFGALWIFIFACGFHAIRRLKYVLDCVGQ